MSIMRKYISIVKVNIIEALKLLFKFKWYVLVYLIFYFMLFFEYLNPPTTDDPIFKFAYNGGLWYYANQEVYIGSMRDDLIIFLCIFLIGTSNMRNHPKLAKIIFISPLIFGVINLIYFMIQNMLSAF